MAILKGLFKKIKTEKDKKQSAEYEQLGKMLVSIYETGYTNDRKFYRMSFIKGVLAGLGGVIGATVVVALFLWILSLFSSVPLLNTLTDNFENTIQQNEVQ